MSVQNTDDKIYFNFSYSALELLGKNMYSNIWSAIAELVANGFDANASNVKIYINATNKEKSIIEIFDNGYGMEYDDLVNKYSIIGKKKREDDSIDISTRKNLMGRKGVGKLAALYLSKKYYLISKTEDEYSAWCLNAKDVKSSDIPRLDKVELSEIDIEAGDFWNRNKTGTMVKLTDVDLRNFGIQSLRGLKARLGDFFLVDSLAGKIEVAFLTHRGDAIKFEKVSKEIAFKNMYAFFDNTSANLKGKLQKSLLFRSTIEIIEKKRRPVVILDEKDFQEISGERCFLLENGEKTQRGIPYKLEGWIGIHSSIEKKFASENDSHFLKNNVYNPNKLRLYVRKKLAVENFLDYLHNTQTFINYIEGEISFDVLDEDELPDIATSNRQGFDEDSDRIKLLVELLNPIVNALIKQRKIIADEVKAEEQAYHEEQERIVKEKEEAERKRAEYAEQAQKQAESERDKAYYERNEANERADVAEAAKKETEQQLQKRLEQLRIITSLSSQDMELVTNLHHQTNVVATNIQSLITQFVRHNRDKKIINYTIVEELLDKISFENSKIIAFSKFGIKKIFDDFSTKADYNIIEYLSNYINKISSQFTSKTQLNISFVSDISKFNTKFAPIDISIIIDNMISNARKAHANLMEVSVTEMNNCVEICFTSNKPFDERIQDLNVIFEKGYSTTRSTGVGLFHIKNIVNENKWNICAKREADKALFVLTINK